MRSSKAHLSPRERQRSHLTGPITRRDALLRTAALASASMITAAPLTGIAAPLNKPAHREEIDRELQARVSAREIPGVVAMAANEQSVVYEGAFGFRDMSTASRMSTDTVFRIASMVKLLTSEQSQLLMLSSSWDQIADKRSCRSCGASNGPPPLSTASRPLRRRENSRPRSFGARMIQL